MSKHVIIIGAGVAGLEAAGQLSKAGIAVSLIEKEKKSGGHLNDWYKLFPDRRAGSEVIKYLEGMRNNNHVELLLGYEIERISHGRDGFKIATNAGKELSADALVVATGFDLFRSSRKEEYGYGIYDNVITSADLELMFRKGEIKCQNGKYPVLLVLFIVLDRVMKKWVIFTAQNCAVLRR